MAEEKVSNSFDKELEEWLESKKKGFSGKIPRADFIAKIKEVNKLAEQLKKDKNQLSTKNKELETQLKTSQSDLTNRDQTIKEKEGEIGNLKIKSEQSEQKNNEYKENISKLQIKTEEQYKTIQGLENNQEKHQAEDLKPLNLPTDWEQQLRDKKNIEGNFADSEKKLSTAEKKLLELSTLEEKFFQVEEKLIEAEKRPTAKQLQGAVQKEAEKYKDYVKLGDKDKEAINNYVNIQKELEEAQKKLASGPAITQEQIKKLQTYEALKIELEQLKVVRPEKPQKDNSEIIMEIKKLFAGELFAILKEISTNLFSLQSEFSQLKQNYEVPQSSAELPVDYETIKKLNRELYEILIGVKKNLPKDNKD